MPPLSEKSRTSRRSEIAFFLLTVAVSLHFALDYVRLTNPMIGLEDYLHLQIDTPFRYRILPQLLYRVWAYVIAHLHIHLPSLNPPVDSPDNWFMVLLAAASVIGAVYFTAHAIRHITGTSRYKWLSFALVLCAYFDYTLVLNRNLFYPYDLPTLFFFSALTCFAVTGNYWLFALTFIPAELTKETVVIAILIFFLLQIRQDNWKKVVSYCAFLSVLFVIIKYLLFRELYQPCAHCGNLMQNQLRSNLSQLVNPLFWISIFSVFAYLWVAVVALWPWISQRMRYTFAITAAAWGLLMFGAGILREIRIFSELSALLVVVIASGLHRRITASGAQPGETAVSES
ncbi:hypothetical protein [Paracidobacterium acidisoli]|uniref:Uncharacterized protein n=1 Tax=Paracidobacterium acidisoli TaxID=2303751 RepID=A0A372IQ34_9BACT|nr:hypothetical protein [Paracidobacterium acidisoli]MBT9331359.1 hypothetical protein [Paracidobacterium acidisoli]